MSKLKAVLKRHAKDVTPDISRFGRQKSFLVYLHILGFKEKN